MNSAQETSLIGMIADRNKLHVDVLPFQNDRSAAGNKLADAARSEAAADDNALGILPFLQFQIALND